MAAPARVDVLVVGAGPTGLMLAAQLARRGVDVRIIDRHAGPATETRALGVQARTLEIYAALGIADAALERGRIASGANFWVGGRARARLPLGDIGRDLSPYPFLLILGQDENERLLGEALVRHGGSVQWQTELVALQQGAGHVRATLRQPDGSSRDVAASWVAGCDGARSAVRELNGIGFPGAPYEHVFFVADTVASGPMVPGELNVYLWRDGFHLFFPMKAADHWRVVGIVPAPLRGNDHLPFEAVAPSVAREVGAGLEFRSCRWFSTYRIHHRRAERFRAGRCFLLGDAAHIHSPVGAQGMNTGLQDAYNVAWKLALVTSGRAAEGLLDSYAAERMPVAERLLQTTDRAFSLIVSDGWIAKLLRTRVLARVAALALRREAVRRFAFLTISQTGIGYPASALSQTPPGWPDAAPRAGDRFPWLRLQASPGAPAADLYARLDDTRFNLLVIGQAPPAEDGPHADLMLTHVIGADEPGRRRAHIPVPSFFLLRPDGHVGLCGTTLSPEALTRYFAERLSFR